MVMSYIWAGILCASLIFSLMGGTGSAVSQAALTGAQAGMELAFSIAGAICLWSGIGQVMEAAGLNLRLAQWLEPILGKLFPSSKKDTLVGQTVSANICANFLGLGNAATPMGIRAVKAMSRYAPAGEASDEMCRFIVMNTASIQLIPANVAAVRAAHGCQSPFDILPAVWFTSALSVSAGLAAAMLLQKVRRHG